MRTNTNLYVFDGNDESLLAVLSNKNNKQLSFFDDEIMEQLNKDFTFEFTIPMEHADSQYLTDGNRIVFQDKDGDFQEFQIYKTEEEHSDTESRIRVYAEHSIYEINDDIVEDLRVIDGEVAVAMEKALSSSRWKAGQIDSLGIGTVNFYYSNGMENLKKVQETYGGEFKYRVELGIVPSWEGRATGTVNVREQPTTSSAIMGQVDKGDFLNILEETTYYYKVKFKGGIIGYVSKQYSQAYFVDREVVANRYVDLLVRRGADTNKRYEYTKDIRTLKRTIDRSGIKTALYGRGKGEETENNGYSRKVTFEFVEWSKANGDPLDKPYGQKWLGDPDALVQFGRKGRHRFGAIDVDSVDPLIIIDETYKALLQVNKPLYTIEVEGQDLEIVGLSHEAVRLGDTVFIIDKTFKPVLRVEARVIEIRTSMSQPENIKVVLGNFLPLSTDIANELEDLKADFTDRKGVWDKVEDIDPTITDDSFEDIIPNVPTGFEATGLFKSIAVEWDFDPSAYIATYEVYGSKVKGFTVDPSNLLFRGKTGGYVHKADTNETWYFRILAVNTHGKKSQLTAEFSGSTIRIATADYEDLSIVNAKIADLSVDNAKIAKATITDAEIKSLNADKIIAGRLQAQFVEIGSTTTYANGYDPSQKATPTDVTNAENRAKDYAKPMRQGTFDPKFLNGRTFWTYEAEGIDPLPISVGKELDSTESQEGGKVLEFSQMLYGYSRNAIPVNTNRVYQVTFRVRQTVDPTDLTKARVYAGVATLDKDYKLLTGGAGTHRYCATYDSVSGGASYLLTVADGWQTFTGLITTEGDTHNTFRAGTKYVRPMFIVNYTGGDGTVQIDLMDFKDVTEIQELQTVVDEVSLRTESDKIIATVRSSSEYEADLIAKANSSDLEGYATTDALGQAVDDLEGSMDEKIGQIDFTPYATKTEVEQTATALDVKFSSSGGVNLLKNSVGFAGTDFWSVLLDKDSYGVIIGSIDTRQGGTIIEKGSGSAFVLKGAKLTQSFNVATDNLTLSAVIKKPSGVDGYIQVTYDNGLIEKYTLTTTKEYDYEKIQLNIQPTGNNFTVEMYGGLASEVIITSLMCNVGNVALQWQHSSGEVYNTNVLMDLNGIRVISNQYNGYTSITPEEFSGYAEVDGEMTRVFTLNKDTTEMEKAKVRSEIGMTPIKVIPVQSLQYNGWAFISDSGRNPNLAFNTDYKDGMTNWVSWGSDTDKSIVAGTSSIPTGMRVFRKVAGTGSYGVTTPWFSMVANTVYTVSFTIESKSNSGYSLDYLYLREGTPTPVTLKGLPNVDLSKAPKVYGLDNAWRVEFEITHDVDLPVARLLIGQFGNSKDGQGFILREFKVEEGKERTQWLPE